MSVVKNLLYSNPQKKVAIYFKDFVIYIVLYSYRMTSNALLKNAFSS